MMNRILSIRPDARGKVAITRPGHILTVPNSVAVVELQLDDKQLAAVDWSQLNRLTKLTALDFGGRSSQSVHQLPDAIGSLTALERLNLSFCRSLQLLPESVGHLTALQQLNLSGCESLKQLPDSLGNLTALQRLSLPWCSSLQRLPESVGNLSALQELNLSWCDSLQQLPDSICNLTALQQLNLSGCESLKQLPDSLGNLTALQRLDLSWCESLQQLPDSIGKLAALQALNLSGCESLRQLPYSIGQLLALQELDVSGCSSLQQLPESLQMLTALQKLNVHMEGCPRLQRPDWLCQTTAAPGGLKPIISLAEKAEVLAPRDLPRIAPSVKSLFVKLNAEQLASMDWSPLANLSSLGYLDLSGCPALRQLPAEVCRLTALQSLTVAKGVTTEEGYWKQNIVLEDLPDQLSSLTGLTRLVISGCKSLKLPDSLGQLSALQSLDLSGCESLQRLPTSSGNLAALKTLDLSGCDSLQQLPYSIGSLTALQRLSLPWCSSLQRLPESVGNLSALQELHLSWCDSLQQLPATNGSLAALTRLSINQCTSLRRLPMSCTQLTQLQHLVCWECPAAREQPPSALSGYLQIRWLLERQQRTDAIKKLASQQEPMITSLERMSWLVVLLATATFIAYLQPPGGLGDDKQVLVTRATTCSGDWKQQGTTDFRMCAMLVFFVLDGLSFGLSMGCLVMIVMLSMPRIQWSTEEAEAGRFYLLLCLTWLLLYLAVVTGFAAFVASGLSVHNQVGIVVGPVMPGALLLLVGALLFVRRFLQLFPGWDAIKACFVSSDSQFSPPQSDVEQGQERFWLEWQNYLPVITETVQAAYRTRLAADAGGAEENQRLLGDVQAGAGSSAAARSSQQQPAGGGAAAGSSQQPAGGGAAACSSQQPAGGGAAAGSSQQPAGGSSQQQASGGTAGAPVIASLQIQAAP